jgi:hypothetical protein
MLFTCNSFQFLNLIAKFHVGAFGNILFVQPPTIFVYPLQIHARKFLLQLSRGKSGWKNSCGDSTVGERQPIYTGVRGVLAGRLAGHKTMPASSLIHGAPPLTPIYLYPVPLFEPQRRGGNSDKTGIHGNNAIGRSITYGPFGA